jgi:hypothetical protein
MRFSRCQRVVVRAVVAAVALGATVASTAVAKPRPSKPGGFRLFSSAQNIFTANRVQCRVFSSGQICATGSSTVGGGIWPRGTADQYVFGSGINIAGVIAPGDKSVNGFAGDTAGAFFNNTAGGDNGQEVRPIFSSADVTDAANWPDAARVPCQATTVTGPCVDNALGSDPQGDLFDAALQGGVAASQGDLWFVSWEGDPGRLESRAHPLGIAVETRALGWNFPRGNEDIVYFLYTFYNITSTNPADYATIRPSMRDVLLAKAADFQALNTAKYGINLPAGGYTINNLFAAFVADMDVAQADANYASVNVPFAMGFTYEHTFSETTARSIGWSFDPAIFGSAPFFNGPGFVGVKYLRSPIDPNTGEEVGLTLFGTFSRSSGSLQDPADDKQLYRYITGGLTPSDGACSLANPLASKICFVNIGSAADMRFFESSGPITLAPGGAGTIVVAYIFAAPVSAGGCPGAGCDVKPASTNDALTILGDPARMASGVNKIDTVTGYLGNINGQPRVIAPDPAPQADPDPTKVTQDEFLTQRGSLLGKALTAQSIFDGKFLLPFAPDRPEFFLVPGNNQVTVLWARSATEDPLHPDPFFQIASQPASPLYDPNFRGNDVEGYRIYRGRTSSPSELQLIAQFDYAPSADGKGIFKDFRSLLNPTPTCAPELGVAIDCAGTDFTIPAPGEPYVNSVDVDLVGTITQVTPGNRVLLADGKAQLLPGVLDTAFADISRGRIAQGVSTQLVNNGVPFLFIDRNVRNSLRYFYSVVAFDVNSLVSGLSSLESNRATKAVTPTPPVSNAVIQANLVSHTIGRDGVAMDTVITSAPTLDPATGKFSGPAQPTDGGGVAFVGEFAASVIQPSQTGALTMRLDSLHMGVFGNIGAVFGVVSGATVPVEYFVTLANGVDSFKVLIPHVPINFSGGGANGASAINEGVDSSSAFFEALTVDPATASKFEGSPPFKLQGQATVRTPPGQYNGGWGVGSKFLDFGTATTSIYNGSRWFDGPSPTANETVDNPNLNNCVAVAGGSGTPLGAADCGAALTNFNNAGGLTGVTTIQQALGYISLNGTWRNMDWILPTVHRAADFNVYWGTAGLIDSVIDVSNNVVVPFQPYMGGGYGILNTSAGSAVDGRAAVGTLADIGCVEPMVTGPVAVESSLRIPCPGTAVALSNTAVLGPVAFFRNGNATTGLVGGAEAATNAPAADPGFIFYLAGDVFAMSMPALPASGAVWALRTYAGEIVGSPGAYAFTPAPVRPFNAVGVTQALEFGVTSIVANATNSDLRSVHTVPDPYYVKSAYEASTDQKVLKFVGLPQDAIIRIYSASGVLVRMLEHHGGQYSSTSNSQGDEINWDLRNRNNQVVASGVYFFHVEAGDARRVGRFTVVNFAQ